MIHTATTTRPERRRGALLLLVLSVLTLFMMIGTLMLVLAMRARSTARAFANAVTGSGFSAAEARDLLDEALLTLLRGTAPSAGGGTPIEALLTDRYGSTWLQGQLTAAAASGAIVQATVTGINAAPLDLQGRIATLVPQANDSAPITSFRILRVNGQTFDLANLRTIGVRPLPTVFPCTVIINGREFAGGGGNDKNEAWDAFDAANPFLTQASVAAPGGSVTVTRPAFGAGQPVVDNDGDGTPDGVWLTNVLPAPASGRQVRVSFLVLDLGGRINVNAHGSVAANAGTGPAAVDGSKVFPNASPGWTRILSGGDSPDQPQAPTTPNRRPPAAIGRSLQGRFGSGPTTTYDLRLDFDGSRLASRQSPRGNVFTCGELEPVLRPFDADSDTLPPRLAALLGADLESVRMLVTTDGWDTCGLTGQAARDVVARGNPATLPAEVAEGLRFNLDRVLDTLAAKEKFLADLFAVLVAAGAPNGATTAQWLANVIEFIDTDQQADQYTTPTGGKVTGVEPSSVQKDGQPVLSGWDRGRLESAGELLGVPSGTKPEIDDRLTNNLPLTSLVITQPTVLDAVSVPSPFRTTVFATGGGRTLCRWREPGRVNVNSCDKRVWDAVTGQTIANPFGNAPAQSAARLMLDVPELFSRPDKDVRSLDRGLANRLAAIGTTRSDVFAVWITLELKDSAADPSPDYHRLFAVVDRSIPVGHALGQNLNARDAIRVVRHLE